MSLSVLPPFVRVIVFLGLLPFWIVAAFFVPGTWRRLPPEPSPPRRVPGTDFLEPIEVIDPGEAAMFARIAEQHIDGTRKGRHPAGAGADPKVYNEHHAHTPVIMRGTLAITAEGIAELPEPMRVGLFAAPGRFEVVARFQTLDRAVTPVEAYRLSLKIAFGPDAEMDILVAVRPDDPGQAQFPLRDATEFFALAGMPWSVMSPTGLRFLARSARLLRAAQRIGATLAGPFGVVYDSATAYRLGPACAVWELQPRQDHPRSTSFDAASVQDLARSFLDDRGEVAFDFGVRLATERGTPGNIRCCEDGLPRWDPEHCPFFGVGVLTFSPASWDEATAEFGGQSSWGNKLRFNIFNTPAVHRPLGQNNRLRRSLYDLHSDARRDHYYGDAAPTMTRPFEGPSANDAARQSSPSGDGDAPG